MKHKHALLAIIAAVLLVPVFSVGGGETQSYSYSLGYRFENRGKESVIILEQDLMVPCFLNTTWQTVYVEEATHPFTVTTADEDGNQALVMEITRELGAGEIIGFNVTYKIESTARPKPDINLEDAEGVENIPVDLILKYTSSSETFMSDNQMIVDLSNSLVMEDDTVLEKTLKLLEYVIGETDYYNFEHPLYPVQTIEGGQGDCDDMSILLISMLRSLRIPAYLQVGLVIHPDIRESKTSWDGHLKNIQEGVGWHGWAMVYIPPWEWVPVDLTMIRSHNVLDNIRNAPEYEPNIIPAINVSDQVYIGETLAVRDRIINSSLYITLTDRVNHSYGNRADSQKWLIVFLGAATLASIALMFYSKN